MNFQRINDNVPKTFTRKVYMRHMSILKLMLNDLLSIFSFIEDVLKCYMCTSLSNESCGSNFTTNSLQPVECTDNKIMKWQISIQQHNVLNKVAQLFKDNEILQYHQGVLQDMACAKMILNSK